MTSRKAIDEIGLRCIGCGLCEGVCPVHAVKVVESSVGLKPVVNASICKNCGLCLELCPVIGIARAHTLDDLKKVKFLFQGYSREQRFYFRGASGGVISSILYYLFDKNIIDSALVAFYDDKLNIYGDWITSKHEVIKHSGSYYQTSKQMLNVRKISGYKSVAVVGLPCHIEAFKKYAKKFNLDNIAITISLFCTIGRMRIGLKKFLKEKFNIDLDSIQVSNHLSRFGKERPGKIIIMAKRPIKYTCLEYLNYVDYFYTPIGCFNCRKIFGLNADISVGDDWGIKSCKKIALVIANTDKGASLLKEIKTLRLRAVDEDEAVPYLLRSQPNGTAIKIGRHVETKLVLILTKFVGLAFIKLRFPRKIIRMIRELAWSYIRKRAY